ncbi:MAG: sulfotransferase domain-containing protein [Chloroflexi bacterium]|nr:sulfotransferase domain-containing protein [Chloroflexota bacterium]
MKKRIAAIIPTSLRNGLRLSIYRAEVLLQRAKFAGIKTPAGGWPILMANSFPKSGSHLLDQVLMGFSRVAPFSSHVALPFFSYDGETGKKRTPQEALAYISALHPLDVTGTHLLAWPEVVDAVCTPRFIPYIIFRDPRDIVVSHVFYITEMAPGHAHYQYYTENLKNFDERLKISILGLPEGTIEFPDIARRFELYRGWLDRPQVLVLRFEDFIHNRHETIGRVADHFLKRVDTLTATRDQIIDALESNIDPQRSPTFRSGKTGEWKKYFRDEHKKLFKEVAGDLLVQLGYEKDNNW